VGITCEVVERRCNVLMRRVKVVLAVVAAAVVMMMLAAPAMAQVVGYCDEYGVCTYWNPDTGSGYSYWPVEDECGYFWDPEWEVWYWACWED
jgi:hypothetical protein